MKDEEQLRLFDLLETEKKTLTFKPLRQPIWTQNKARLIARYLYYFVQITKHGTYIDGFAGPQAPNLPDSWAARLVIESEPRWLNNFFLCDNNPEQVNQLRELEINALRDRRPGDRRRKIELYCGDFNDLVYQILSSGKVTERSATFCLLDQRTFECEWRTVKALAKHKFQRKIEQFYFVPTGWLSRALSALKNHEVAERWWGQLDFGCLRNLPSYQCADQFCRRFKNELGYKYAYAWPIFEGHTGGRLMYHMVHATDHPVAPNLMARAYRKARDTPEPPEQFEFAFEHWKSIRQQDAANELE